MSCYLLFLPRIATRAHLDNHKDEVLSVHYFIFYIVRLLTRNDTLHLLLDYTNSVKRTIHPAAWFW